MEELMLLDLVNECETDEDIKELMDAYIDVYNELSYDLNPISSTMKVIGRDIDINPEGNYTIYTNNKWFGFIPNDVKVVTDKRGCYNKGCYYYLNDRKYLYDFAKFIKGEKIKDEAAFVAYVYLYMHYYFENIFNPMDREVVNGLLLNQNDIYYPPVKEHDISDFKFKGSAKCSELSVMAQNIMSIFGYNSLIVFDESHAYNIFYQSKDDAYILDYHNCFKFYNHNLDLVKEVPFMAKIDNYNDDILEDLLYQGGRVEFDDVYFIKFGQNSVPFFEGYKRIYKADGVKIKRK